MKKQYSFILRCLSLKFLCDQTIKTVGLILQRNICHYCAFRLLLLISEHVQKSK